jgi:chemotaxis protein CheD
MMSSDDEWRPELSSAPVSLGQGDIICSAVPRILATVLGSCVAVCLWDKRRGVGGMNHFVLPNSPNEDRSPRYGDVAIDELEAALVHLGCRMSDLQAKVFGGAAVLPFGGGQTIGSNNVELAMERLRRDRITVTARRTGGTLGQQIRFNTRTGEVLVRYIASVAPRGTARRRDISGLAVARFLTGSGV